MNLAYPVEAPDNQAELMSFRGDFYENVKKIARAGYDGIELLVRDLDSIDTEAVKRCAVENHVKIAAISTAPMDKQDGLHLLTVSLGHGVGLQESEAGAVCEETAKRDPVRCRNGCLRTAWKSTGEYGSREWYLRGSGGTYTRTC